ncbi:phosphatidylserine decarboxylase [Gurleya vavrai]
MHSKNNKAREETFPNINQLQARICELENSIHSLTTGMQVISKNLSYVKNMQEANFASKGVMNNQFSHLATPKMNFFEFNKVNEKDENFFTLEENIQIEQNNFIKDEQVNADDTLSILEKNYEYNAILDIKIEDLTIDKKNEDKNVFDTEEKNVQENLNSIRDVTKMSIYIVSVKYKKFENNKNYILKFSVGNNCVKKEIIEDTKFPLFIKKIGEQELVVKISEKKIIFNKAVKKLGLVNWDCKFFTDDLKIKIYRDEAVEFPGFFRKNIVCRSDYLNALLGVELNGLSFFNRTLQYFNFGNSKWALPDAQIYVKDNRTDEILEEKMYKKVKFYLTFFYTKRLAESKFYRKLIKKMTLNVGRKFSLAESVTLIDPFISYFNINMDEVAIPEYNFKSFNDFFSRKLKPNSRVVENINGISSPADGRLVGYKNINEAKEIWIKGKNFTFENLLGKKANCKSIFVARLAPQDYHRFHSPVRGIIRKIYCINGDYLTVHPVSVKKTNVLTENMRIAVEIDCKYGKCYVVAVGAALVGSIIITVKEDTEIDVLDEIGFFEFGGSTVVVGFSKELIITSNIYKNSIMGIETLLKVGDCIALPKNLY